METKLQDWLDQKNGTKTLVQPKYLQPAAALEPSQMQSDWPSQASNALDALLEDSDDDATQDQAPARSSSCAPSSSSSSSPSSTPPPRTPSVTSGQRPSTLQLLLRHLQKTVPADK
jgi:hypothetical protein